MSWSIFGLLIGSTHAKHANEKEKNKIQCQTNHVNLSDCQVKVFLKVKNEAQKNIL